MKRLLFVGAALFLTAAFAFAHGSAQKSSQATQSAAKTRTISVLMNNYYYPTQYPKVAKMSQALAAKWEKSHPGYKIHLLPWRWSNESNYRTWLTAKVAAGNEPTVAWEQYYKMWDETGWWVPLDKYLQQPDPYAPAGKGKTHWKNVLPGFVWNNIKAPDGHYYTLALEWVETGMYYNKNIFKKAGVSADWKTWPQFINALKKLKEAGYAPLYVSTNAGWSNYQWVDDIMTTEFFASKVPQMYMPKFAKEYSQTYDGKQWRTMTTEELAKAIYDGTYKATGPRFTDELKVIKNWSKYWIPGYSTINYNSGLAAFLSGKVAIAWLGTWSLPQIKSSASFKFGVTYLPPLGRSTDPYIPKKFENVSFRVGGPSASFQLGITAHGKKEGLVKPAVNFLKFLSTPDHMGKEIVAAGQYIPMIRGTKSPPALAYFAHHVAAMPVRAFTDPIGRLTPQAGHQYDIAIQNYLLGQASLAKTESTIQTVLNKSVATLAKQNHYSWYKKK